MPAVARDGPVGDAICQLEEAAREEFRNTSTTTATDSDEDEMIRNAPSPLRARRVRDYVCISGLNMYRYRSAQGRSPGRTVRRTTVLT